jgi:hypothetical protein
MADGDIMSAPHMVLVYRNYIQDDGQTTPFILYINTVSQFVLEFKEILEQIRKISKKNKFAFPILFLVLQAGFLHDDYSSMPAAMVMDSGDINAVRKSFINTRNAYERLLQLLAEGFAASPYALPNTLNALSFDAPSIFPLATSRIITK